MVTITNTTVTREQVWAAFRRTHDVRVRERYHAILLLMDGKSCSEIAQWLYRDEETIRTWVHALNEAGLPGLERGPIPGRPA
jgi:transposase